ncbi:hypothetical protein KUCAC02_024128 [Chaenocephalus aceratus]|uniref:Uncharacterized protein n=1 Tax=Chaenocephalus aceratus TaxID=36190 RepID=A0ACB9WIG7_CHAAC|nr:hypothetical protein KUCAC02_024128 [Chaenocephalus aceratus]
MAMAAVKARLSHSDTSSPSIFSLKHFTLTDRAWRLLTHLPEEIVQTGVFLTCTKEPVSGSGGSGPAAHNRGLDEEITHGQLGFELLTPAFPGSTAWWPQGSASSKRPSYSELADLF